MFTRESMLSSAWYRDRIEAKRRSDIRLWERHESYLKHYCDKATHQEVTAQMELEARLMQARERLEFFKTQSFRRFPAGSPGVASYVFEASKML